tara:strand:- start:10 stop:288 length:279 start_codon:yes stop_codon:yes gene_type:complete
LSQPLYSIADLSKETGFSRQTLRKWRRDGRIPKGKKIGPSNVFTKQERDKILLFCKKWPAIKRFENTKHMRDAWNKRYQKEMMNIQAELSSE